MCLHVEKDSKIGCRDRIGKEVKIIKQLKRTKERGFF